MAGMTIQLTQPQVDSVIRQSGEGSGIEKLLRKMVDSGTVEESFNALRDSPRLSRSLLLGLVVLASFPAGETLAVTDVAGKLGMSASTTHRYMTTLLTVGLLEQDPRTRRYGIPA